MQTYTFAEIKALMRNVDADALSLLAELIEEEEDQFVLPELRAIRRMLKITSQVLVKNQVKAEYLLSYN